MQEKNKSLEASKPEERRVAAVVAFEGLQLLERNKIEDDAPACSTTSRPTPTTVAPQGGGKAGTMASEATAGTRSARTDTTRRGVQGCLPTMVTAGSKAGSNLVVTNYKMHRWTSCMYSCRWRSR